MKILSLFLMRTVFLMRPADDSHMSSFSDAEFMVR